MDKRSAFQKILQNRARRRCVFLFQTFFGRHRLRVPLFPSHRLHFRSRRKKYGKRFFLILEEKQRRARATKRRDAKDIIAPTHRIRINKIYIYLPIYVREFLLWHALRWRTRLYYDDDYKTLPHTLFCFFLLLDDCVTCLSPYSRAHLSQHLFFF